MIGKDFRKLPIFYRFMQNFEIHNQVGLVVSALMVWEYISPKLCPVSVPFTKTTKRRVSLVFGSLFFVGVLTFVLVDCLTAAPKKSENLLGLGKFKLNHNTGYLR